MNFRYEKCTGWQKDVHDLEDFSTTRTNVASFLPTDLFPSRCALLFHLVICSHVAHMSYCAYKNVRCPQIENFERIIGNLKIVGTDRGKSEKPSYILVECKKYKVLYICAKGTSSFNAGDYGKDLQIAIGQLEHLDSDFLEFMEANKSTIQVYMRSGYYLFFCGHSLGGSIINEFNKKLMNNPLHRFQSLKYYNKKLFFTFNKGTGISEITKKNMKIFEDAERFPQIDVMSIHDMITMGTRLEPNVLLVELDTSRDIPGFNQDGEKKHHSISTTKYLISQFYRELNCNHDETSTDTDGTAPMDPFGFYY